MSQADPNRYLRLMPLAAGVVGGVLLLLNRLTSVELTTSQARSDVVGTILGAFLILTGLIWQQVQPRPPESVTLNGTEQFDLLETLPDALKLELAWASHSLLTNTPTQALVIWYRGQVLLRRGILPETTLTTPGPIVQQALTKERPIYLVKLPLYPGRVEFDYLPDNTQGLICQPLGKAGVLILGANAPRSYTRQDERWVTAIAEKIAQACESTLTPQS
ncbi:cofactor assembly of complex C subunit B [Thermosynechococcaceae cyanobacterium BACA0444]|uniref:Cofactor assembly of complex C subunit B n=1 Tax=Pseudocalidococcus azoricus BACA0444 TaxID=2918990 RepID=A0AAE4FVD5_9CYAN|nr:cofactor assembly of complex C subunit B [Pseudocalidococcus azoricus]MDS3862252.1 cofactor assembly of complex C subunit B [Pseudocalidococcus azoricus BACA0444]